MAMGGYTETLLLYHVSGYAGSNQHSTVDISLHNGDPGDDGSNEISDPGYSRKSVGFSLASDSGTYWYVTNSSSVTLADDPAFEYSWTLEYIGAFSGSDFVWKAPFETSKSVSNGDQLTIDAGGIEFRLDS